MPKDHITSPKALILGIDGGSLDVIEPLLAQGKLPNLKALLDSSLHGSTTTTWPAHTAPGWTTFVTARQPGAHGIYGFFDPQHPGYGDRIVGSRDFGCDTVWEWLAEQGLSVGLINVPMSHPPTDVPGYQITWPLVKTLRFSRPSGLLGELSTTGVPFASDLLTMFQGDYDYIDFAQENLRARGRSIRYLMGTRPVDVVMAVVTEIDRVCHHYWHMCDPCHPRHETPPADHREWTDAIGDIYTVVDEVFGELLALIDEETPVLLVSDHGFGQGRSHIGLNTLLEKAGLLVTKPGDGPYAGWFTAEGRTVDFTRTRAYMPSPGSYAINFNLAGRQTSGIVGDSDLKVLTRDITDLVTGLSDPLTGKPTFSAVLPREVAYPGAMSHAAPDLLLVPADEGVLADPAPGADIWRPSYQTGMHRHAGLWALRSPRVEPGRLRESVALLDLVPTLLMDLGLRQRASAAGRPIDAIARRAADPPAYLPETTYSPESMPEVHVRDEDLTAKALAAMGYL